jgi:hypothetical protein
MQERWGPFSRRGWYWIAGLLFSLAVWAALIRAAFAVL